MSLKRYTHAGLIVAGAVGFAVMGGVQVASAAPLSVAPVLVTKDVKALEAAWKQAVAEFEAADKNYKAADGKSDAERAELRRVRYEAEQKADQAWLAFVVVKYPETAADIDALAKARADKKRIQEELDSGQVPGKDRLEKFRELDRAQEAEKAALAAIKKEIDDADAAATPDEEPSKEPSAAPTKPSTVSPSATAPAAGGNGGTGGGDGGGLAVTGTDVATVAGVGAAIAAAGAGVVLITRRRRQTFSAQD